MTLSAQPALHEVSDGGFIFDNQDAHDGDGIGPPANAGYFGGMRRYPRAKLARSPKAGAATTPP
jgi:hypothetical protein